MLALVYGYEISYHIVYGRKIIFLTDHKPLATLKELKTPFGRLGQLLFRLDGVDYSIEYIEGRSNLPDFLSRAHFSGPLAAQANAIELASSFDWPTEQKKDPELLQIISCVKFNADE